MEEIIRLKMMAAELATLAYDLETRIEALSSRPRLFLVKGEEALELGEGDGLTLGGEATEEIE
jgi:hypothetical protein